jgi:hypothetical protein
VSIEYPGETEKEHRMNELTVGDGFKFGCGFMLAAVLAQIGIGILAFLLVAIFGTALGALLEGLAGMVLPF